jgi:hypothetical protein
MCCTGSCAAIAAAAKVATAREITTPHKAAAREKHCTMQHLTTKGRIVVTINATTINVDGKIGIGSVVGALQCSAEHSSTTCSWLL